MDVDRPRDRSGSRCDPAAQPRSVARRKSLDRCTNSRSATQTGPAALSRRRWMSTAHATGPDRVAIRLLNPRTVARGKSLDRCTNSRSATQTGPTALSRRRRMSTAHATGPDRVAIRLLNRGASLVGRAWIVARTAGLRRRPDRPRSPTADGCRPPTRPVRIASRSGCSTRELSLVGRAWIVARTAGLRRRPDRQRPPAADGCRPPTRPVRIASRSGCSTAERRLSGAWSPGRVAIRLLNPRTVARGKSLDRCTNSRSATQTGPTAPTRRRWMSTAHATGPDRVAIRLLNRGASPVGSPGPDDPRVWPPTAGALSRTARPGPARRRGRPLERPLHPA